jgi:hypothetical protein
VAVGFRGQGRITSAASMAVSMRGRPWLTPARPRDVEFAEEFDFGSVFQPMPLPPLPSLSSSGPSEVKRL